MCRTTLIDYDLVRYTRIMNGWTQIQLSYKTDGSVRNLAQHEKDQGERGRFCRRLERHAKRTQLAGLSVACIGHLERGKPVFLETAVILAETLDLPLDRLLRPSPPNNTPPPPPGPGDGFRPGV